MTLKLDEYINVLSAFEKEVENQALILFFFKSNSNLTSIKEKDKRQEKK